MKKAEREAIKVEYGFTDEFVDLLVDLDRKWARYGEPNFLKRTLNNASGKIAAGMGVLLADRSVGT